MVDAFVGVSVRGVRSCGGGFAGSIRRSSRYRHNRLRTCLMCPDLGVMEITQRERVCKDYVTDQWVAEGVTRGEDHIR